MSVNTVFKEKISQARSNLTDAIQNLNEALDENTWGNSDYTDDYKQNLAEIAFELYKLRSKLK